MLSGLISPWTINREVEANRALSDLLRKSLNIEGFFLKAWNNAWCRT